MPKQKHGWDENAGIYHCSDGPHNSWWLSIAKTPQWREWYKHASKNMLYDVAECEGCGWMSVEHARDFMNFISQRVPSMGGKARWANKTDEEKKKHMSMMGKLGGKPKKQAIL